MFEGEARFVVKEGLILEQIDEECLVLDMERNVYFGLESMGRAIWNMAEQGASFGQIVDVLQRKYQDQTRGRLEREVGAFFEGVIAQGLMTCHR